MGIGYRLTTTMQEHEAVLETTAYTGITGLCLVPHPGSVGCGHPLLRKREREKEEEKKTSIFLKG